MSLEKRYISEVEANIDEIRSALERINANGQFDESITEIMNCTLQLMDLGMIHGYEGVEAIAERMYTAARYCALNGPECLESVKPKLQQSVSTLQDVVELNDSVSAQKLVDQTKTEMDYTLDEIPSDNGDAALDPNTADPFRHQPPRAEMITDNFLEINDLDGCEEDEEPQEMEERISDGPVDEAAFEDAVRWSERAGEELLEEDEPKNDFIKAFEDGEVIMLEHAFDTRIARRVFGSMEKLTACLAELEMNSDLHTTWQEVALLSNDLRHMSQNAALEPLSDIFFSMEMIAERAFEAAAERQASWLLLTECRDFIQEYLDNKRIATGRLIELKSRLELFLDKPAPDEEPGFAADFDDEEDDEDDDSGPPPRIPFIVRLRRFFGMY